MFRKVDSTSESFRVLVASAFTFHESRMMRQETLIMLCTGTCERVKSEAERKRDLMNKIYHAALEGRLGTEEERFIITL